MTDLNSIEDKATSMADDSKVSAYAVSTGAAVNSSFLDNENDSFEYFPLLPPELRIKIFVLALDALGSRIITFNKSRVSKSSNYHIDGSSPRLRDPDGNVIAGHEDSAVALLHVNSEARIEALKVYKLAFQYECYRPTYMDPSRDVVMCNDENTLKRMSPKLDVKRITPIKNWAIRLTRSDDKDVATFCSIYAILPRSGFYGACVSLLRLLLFFNWNLETIFFVHEEWNEEFSKHCAEEFCTEMYETVFLPTQGDKNYFSKFRGKTRWMPTIRHVTAAQFESGNLF